MSQNHHCSSIWSFFFQISTFAHHSNSYPSRPFSLCVCVPHIIERNTEIIHLFSKMGFKSSIGFLLSLSLTLSQVIRACIMMLTRCGLCSFVGLFLLVCLLTQTWDWAAVRVYLNLFGWKVFLAHTHLKKKIKSSRRGWTGAWLVAMQMRRLDANYSRNIFFGKNVHVLDTFTHAQYVGTVHAHAWLRIIISPPSLHSQTHFSSAACV